MLMARVALHEGETQHWFKTQEGHVAITCLTHRHGAPITAILPTLLGNSRGIFGIPEIGTEVALGFDGGEYEADGVVLAVYGGVIPALLTDEAKIVIVGDTVCVVPVAGGTPEPLVKKSEFDGHTHTVPDLVGTTSYGTTYAGGTQTDGAADVTGTNALKAT